MQGAFYTGVYRNVFLDAGFPAEEIEQPDGEEYFISLHIWRLAETIEFLKKKCMME